MNIFLDFDGTLVDVSYRYIRVHEAALGKTASRLSQDEYWKLKCEKMPEEEMLKKYYADIDASAYLKHRQHIIEDPKFLAFDRLFPESVYVLETLKRKGYSIWLVTLRKKPENVRGELTSLDILDYFEDVLTSEPGANPAETKANLMRPHAKKDEWMAGDTEADIEAGKMLGLKTCGLESGIRTPEFIKNCQPTMVAKTLAEFVAFVTQGL